MAANDRALSGWVIFSAPTASTASCTPVATACQARWNAVEADAQAFSTLKTGEYAGLIGVNEMVAFKLPMSLYLKFMQEAHHDAPDREEDKLAETARLMQQQAEEAGSHMAEGDGMVAMRESKPLKGVFYT